MNAASRPLVGVVAALAVAAAACGSSTSKSSPQGAASSGGQSASSAGAPTSAGPTVDANELTALAKAAAGKAGAPVKVPPKTIGYLRYVAAAPADQRVYEAAVAAAAVLGWKVIPCDGAGDPTKLAACGNTLLNQKIDALLDDGVPPSIIATSLARAKAAGIPTLYSGGTVDNAASYSAGYVPPDGQMDPQDPGSTRLARQAPPVHGALHPDLLVLDQPGETVLRLRHRRPAPTQ
jgi:ABC-type sugar transport system substrate-binding protein